MMAAGQRKIEGRIASLGDRGCTLGARTRSSHVTSALLAFHSGLNRHFFPRACSLAGTVPCSLMFFQFVQFNAVCLVCLCLSLIVSNHVSNPRIGSDSVREDSDVVRRPLS